MTSVFDVAHWFLSKESMSPKKLQKLSYYYYAWGYALYDKQMIDDTVFEAWIHGPVSPELYRHYKKYVWEKIPQYQGDLYPFSEEEKSLLESIYFTYGDKSANELEALTHQDLPWIKARMGCDPHEACTRPLNPEDMRSYYRSIYAKDQGD